LDDILEPNARLSQTPFGTTTLKSYTKVSTDTIVQYAVRPCFEMIASGIRI
jgi:hypothetical protein